MALSRVLAAGSAFLAAKEVFPDRPAFSFVIGLCCFLVPVLLVPIVAALLLQVKLFTGSRAYDGEVNSVGREYDAWTTEGILEQYWGEHIHLGYYTKEEMAKGYLKKDFIEAKYDFVDRMMEWGGVSELLPKPGAAARAEPLKVLDVGCGIGGTSRYLAKKFGADAEVSGITLSQEQVNRATQLCKERGINNADFCVMDALAMTHPDNSFDVVWACESGEHMPDKRKYVQEMTRVLKPGGKLVIATWCQKEIQFDSPLTKQEEKTLDYLYKEWSHPYFVPYKYYGNLLKETGAFADIGLDDWTEPTIAAWRHSIWVGVFNPWPVIRTFSPRIWWKCIRDAFCLDAMHRAFDNGLMEYGMIRGTKSEAKSE
jgi:MPBQ/MSBQ methyltransferase